MKRFCLKPYTTKVYKATICGNVTRCKLSGFKKMWKLVEEV